MNNDQFNENNNYQNFNYNEIQEEPKKSKSILPIVIVVIVIIVALIGAYIIFFGKNNNNDSSVKDQETEDVISEELIEMTKKSAFISDAKSFIQGARSLVSSDQANSMMSETTKYSPSCTYSDTTYIQIGRASCRERV